MSSSAVAAFDMCFPSACFCFIRYIGPLLMPFHGVNSLFSFSASIITFQALSAFTLLAQANTYSLVISFVFITAVTSPTFSVIISPLFIHFLNCSFNFLSLSLYLFSSALILRWHIYSIIFLFCFVISLQYCNDNIDLLGWGLNLSLNTSNTPILILHFSGSSQFRVYANLNPSMPNQLNITGALSISCVL